MQARAASRAAGVAELDLILVPALAATQEGARLGFGSGFYDRVLPVFRASPRTLSLIVLYEFQVVAALPTEPHDFFCDALLTEQRLYDLHGVLGAPP